MLSAETSKKENTEEKTPMSLKVTIEDPNTGDTMVIQPRFLLGFIPAKTIKQGGF